MAWSTVSPNGALSVKANLAVIGGNTTYTQITMGNGVVGTNDGVVRDHFWNVSANLDGRHRFIQSPAFTVGGNPADPVLGAGMDAVQYVKTVAGSVQGFYLNASGAFQHIPAYFTGTVNIANTNIQDIVTTPIPPNCYGEIFMFTGMTGVANDTYSCQTGFFRSDATRVDAWATSFIPFGGNSPKASLYFGNGTGASGFKIRGGNLNAPTIPVVGTNWTYKITYRAL